MEVMDIFIVLAKKKSYLFHIPYRVISLSIKRSSEKYVFMEQN